MTKLFKVGDLLRYAKGPTALMKVMGVDKDNERYYGMQCLGAGIAAYHTEVSAVLPADLKEWNSHERWREAPRRKAK